MGGATLIVVCTALLNETALLLLVETPIAQILLDRGTVVLGKEVSLWFDEEALFNGAASRGGINLRELQGNRVVLIGNVLIAGPIDQVMGNETDHPLNLEDVQTEVQWLTSQLTTAYAIRQGFTQPTAKG